MESEKIDIPTKSVNLSPEKVTIGAIVSLLFLVFGAIVVFANQFGGGSTTSASPSPAPDGLFQAGAGLQINDKVKGAQTAQQQVVQNYGVEQPPPVPTPTAKPTNSSAPTASPTASPSPSPAASSNSSDTAGPQISEIQSEGVENNKATIKWKTNEDADQKIEYGKDTSYGKTKDSADKKTSHALDITDLEANTTYHFRIISKDGAGNSTTSGDNQFTTKP